MADKMIIKGEIWYPRLTKPSNRFDHTKPKWEVQFRTTDPQIFAKLKEEKVQMTPKISDAGGVEYYFINLSKRATKENDGVTMACPPVNVVDSKLNPFDGGKIGNGTIAKVSLFLRDGYKKGGKGEIDPSKRVPVLLGVQVLKLIPYEGKGSDFQEEDGFEVDELSAGGAAFSAEDDDSGDF